MSNLILLSVSKEHRDILIDNDSQTAHSIYVHLVVSIIFMHRRHRGQRNGPIYKSIANSRRARIYMSIEGLSLICGSRICGGADRRGVNCDGLIADQTRIEMRARE